MDVLKTNFEETGMGSDEQKYIVKSYESTTNSNIAVTYNNRFTMSEDLKKLLYFYEF